MRTKVVSLKHPFSHVLLCVRQEPGGCWRFEWWKAAIDHTIPDEPPEQTLGKAFPYPELAADYFANVLDHPEDFQLPGHRTVTSLMPPAPKCEFYWPPPLEICIDHYETDLIAQPGRQMPIGRVIILGAGFSAAFQFSTAATIVPGVMSFFEKWRPSDWYQAQYERVRWWLDSKFSSSWHESPPSLYELLGSFVLPGSKLVLERFVEAGNPLFLFTQGVSWESEDCDRWITEHSHLPISEVALPYLLSFNALAASYLLIGFSSHRVAQPWATELFRQLSPDDVILTFNWDVIPEFLMTTCSIPFCRYDWTNERIRLAKLHGSVDLFGMPNLVMRADLQVMPERFECITAKLWRARTSEDVLVRTNMYPFGRALEPCERYNKAAALVITPFDLAPYAYRSIQFNWRKALTALERTREVHVIGYSMPEEDAAFRLLAKKVVRKWDSNVTVDIWNPDPLAGERAGQLFGEEHVTFHQADASCFRLR